MPLPHVSDVEPFEPTPTLALPAVPAPRFELEPLASVLLPNVSSEVELPDCAADSDLANPGRLVEQAVRLSPITSNAGNRAVMVVRNSRPPNPKIALHCAHAC